MEIVYLTLKIKEKSNQNIEVYHNKSEFSGLVFILLFVIWTALPVVYSGYLCGPFQEFSFQLATAEKEITKDLPPPLGFLESNQ